MVKISFLTLGAAWTAAVQSLECYPGGPLVPRPQRIEKFDAVRNALAKVTSTLHKAFNGEIRAGFDVKNTSVSLGLVSFDQADPSAPVWEYHHLSPANVRGTKRIDHHSQYLIGSVTKAISDAILLQHNLKFDDPITKYIPALADKSSLIQWENITLGALAGQVAGVVPNYGFSEYYYLKDWFETLGFPRIENTSYPECDVIALNGPCTKDRNAPLAPHRPTQARPVYSNVAFTLLMYALGSVTNKDIPQLFHDITVDLGMPSTRPSPGDEPLAVIPPVDNTWGADFGDNVPGGGLVSTLADLSAFVHAILARDPVLGTETQIRAWLQPGAFTGSPSSTVGSPWEIYRPEPSRLFPSGGGHTVTILSKDGASYGYHARISLLDEYGLGIVILTAGDQSALVAVLNAVASIVIPAVDAGAREQAKTLYVGRFKSKPPPPAGAAARSPGNSKGITVEATTEIDGESLKLTRLTRDGKDILGGLEELWTATAGQFLPAELLNLTGVWRLYPAEVLRERERVFGGGDGGKTKKVAVVEEDWRLAWGVHIFDNGNPNSDLPGGGISAGDCLLWVLADWLYYDQESADRFVFVKEAKTGRILGLEAPFLRSGLMEMAG